MTPHRRYISRLLSIVCMLVPPLTMPSSTWAQVHSPRIPVERTPGIKPGSIIEAFVKALEEGHNLKAWKQHEAAVFDVELTLGENKPVSCTVTLDTGSPRYVLATADGPLLGHDGKASWSARTRKEIGEAAVHLHALPQILAMPFQLRSDKLIIGGGQMMRELGDQECHALSLGHVDNDNWSILFARPGADRVAGLAYFVRLSEDDEPEFSQAYAVVADEYETTDDVPLARTWKLWRWSRPKGLVGDEPIGTIRVKSVTFRKLDDTCFKRPGQGEAKP